jgi:urease accessory protein
VAMGETVTQADLRDRWRVRRDGHLIFADDIAFDGAPPLTRATLGESRAFATVFLAHDGAEALADRVCHAIGDFGSASAWNGKLVARLAARDGFELRKPLNPVLSVLADGLGLPKVWSL